MKQQYSILRIAAVLLAPLILLFAFYVQFHGDYSPGGGFQAGVIFATAIILYALVFGVISTRSIFSMSMLRFSMAAGPLVYGGVGVVSIIYGGAFLDYAVLGSTPQSGRHLGIFLVEVGVGITVASTLIIIFRSFTTRARTADPKGRND